MKKLSIILLLFFTVAIANAQHKKIDTLRAALSTATADTARVNILMELGVNYFISNPDSCIIFSLQAYDLAGKNKIPVKQARALNNMANAYATMGDYVKGIQLYVKSLRIYETINDVPGTVNVYNNIGATYVQDADYKDALRYLQIADKLWEPYIKTHKLKKFGDRESKDVQFINFGECYLYTNKIDSADYYLQICYQDAKKNNFNNLINNIERDLGEVEIARGHKISALKYLREAITISKSNDDVEMLSMSYLSTSKLYHYYKQQDSAEYYAMQALEIARSGKYQQDVLNAGKVLYTYYDEDHNLPEAYKYFKLTTAAKDSLYSQDKVKQLLSIDFEEKQRKQDIAAAQSQYREKVRTYALLAGLAVLLFLVFVFWRNGKQRQVANQLLQTQKEEIQSALSKLELTKDQLIQSEKMASLGELTAGIAHEIQNPLNFVNNFSEVSIELIDEMDEELNKGDTNEAKTIAADIKQNLEKIRHHGRRADGIVKGMLQHSRASSTTKEPTDINKLADEYLRLAYHGLRAKDKSFNAEMVMLFDKKLPVANVVPQDIGRVLLNLFTNAFYAIQQKQKIAGTAYKPTVEVSTRLITPFSGGRAVEIKVKDNGNGIPDNIKDKIMQPFFTTKPTGEGTGLGLSLSYDIVVKGHGGNLNVLSKDEEYTEFIISIPL
jgi:two-component system NtrC family sensor kinase